MVFHHIARIIPIQEDAEEIYQDVFVKAFKNIKQYDSSKASLATWLIRIAHNESINFARRNKPPIIYVDDRTTDLESIQDKTLAKVFQQQDEQTILIIEKALEYLPPDEQIMLTMFYFDNISLKEIAYITDTTPSNVATRLSRTRRKLYRIIKSFKE